MDNKKSLPANIGQMLNFPLKPKKKMGGFSASAQVKARK